MHCDSDAVYYFRFVSHYNLTNFPHHRGSLPVGNGSCSDHVVVGSPNICALFAIPNYFDYPNWKSIYPLPTTFSGSSAQMYLSFSTVSYTKIITRLMSGSCHLDSVSNVEIGVECQIFVSCYLF